MAIIANDTQFIGIAPSIDLTGKKSAILNEQTEPVTMLDIVDTVSAGLPPSAPKMLISFMSQSGANDPSLQGPFVADFLPSIMSRNAVGQYQIIFPSGTLTKKTIVTILSQAAVAGTASGLINVTPYWYADSIQITTKNPSTNALTDGYLENAIIQIQVYE